MTLEDYKFRRRIGIAFIAILLFFSLILNNWRPINIDNLEKATGEIVSKQILKENYKGNNYRYTFAFQLNNLDQILGIFLGSGDEAISNGDYYDNLIQIGQTITVYYDNNMITKFENITRLIYRIEIQNKIIFSRDKSRGWILSLILVIPVPFFILLLIWLKRKKDREKKNKNIY